MVEMSTIKMTSKKTTLCRWPNHSQHVMARLDQRNKEAQYKTKERMTLQWCLAKEAQVIPTASCERSLSGTSRAMSTSHSRCQCRSSSRSINRSRNAPWLRTNLATRWWWESLILQTWSCHQKRTESRGTRSNYSPIATTPVSRCRATGRTQVSTKARTILRTRCHLPLTERKNNWALYRGSQESITQGTWPTSTSPRMASDSSGLLGWRRLSKNWSRGDTNTSTTTIIKTLSQELHSSMARTRAVAIRCPERAGQGAKEVGMATAEATAVVASPQVTTTAEALSKPSPSSLAPICSTQETSRISIVDRSSCRGLTHAWICQGSTIRGRS